MNHDALLNKIDLFNNDGYTYFTHEELQDIKEVISEHKAYKISYGVVHNIALSLALAIRNYSGSIVDIMQIQDLLSQLREVDPDTYALKVKDVENTASFESLMTPFDAYTQTPSQLENNTSLLLMIEVQGFVSYMVCTYVDNEFVDINNGNKIINPAIIKGWFVIPNKFV